MEIRIGTKVQFFYINYKQQKGFRKALVQEIFYGSTDFHPKGQWLMRGLDLDKNEERIYAIHDMMNFSVLEDEQ